MNKKLKLILKYSFVAISIFAIVRGMYLVYENHVLERKLYEAESKRDDFYGQLREISSIMLELNKDVSKKDLYDSIQHFRHTMHLELKADSISFYDGSIPFFEKENMIHGYHDELIFVFENEKLVNINYGDFKPYYRRLN
jgi:hypothetical protein